MSTHALPRPNFVHLADVVPRPALLNSWERLRHRQAHWFVECLAEFMGVFFYVFAGVGSTAAYVLGNIAGEQLSSIFQIGVAYAIGIVLALVVCSSTSGGHFNPAVTIAHVVTHKFPPLKALRYIVCQILGGYVASLIIYVQYHNLITQVETALAAAGKLDAINFTPNGPAGIFAFYALPGSKLGQVFLNEFVCDFLIGMVIWACLDPTNFLISPTTATWTVGLTYAMVAWGYSPVGVAANSARDLGGRLMAITIWGRAGSGGSYAAIAALTNIPATLCGVLFYELVLTDSSRVITPAHVDFLAGHRAHEEHSTQSKIEMQGSPASSYSGERKEKITAVEEA